MITYNSPRRSCGAQMPSNCVSFQGRQPSFIADADFPCTVTLTDVIDQISTRIENLLDVTDLTGLNKQCLNFDPATIKAKGLFQILTDTTCSLKARIETLEDTVDDLNLDSQLVTVDLGELTPINNPCSPNTNSYTLFYVLNVLANAINSGTIGGGGGSTDTTPFYIEVVAGQPSASAVGIIVGNNTFTNTAIADKYIQVVRQGVVIPGINPLNGGPYYTKIFTSNTLLFSTPIEDEEVIRINTL